MPIRELRPEVAAKIAAGEVVERPASVVKEMVENSLDAQASSISVEVRGGGLELIRVVDNGIGIPFEEVALAFRRHATSKVWDVSDLEAISTLGFRGEALASIAAVSQVSILTRARGQELGVYVDVKDGVVQKSEHRGAPSGTTITVRRLFQNLPARLKFLKSPAAEASRAQGVLLPYILAYPNVKFSLTSDGRTVFSSPGGGRLQDALSTVYGAETAGAMLSVEAKGEVEVSGWISPPSITRANRSYIHLFINGRPVQSRLLSYALEEAYHGLIPEGRSPVAVIGLRLPYNDVDVNVHPAKAEVRFRKEREVFSALQRAVREALISQSPVPSVSTLLPAANPYSPGESIAMPLQNPGGSGGETAKERGTDLRSVLLRLRVLGQVQSTYIIAEGKDGLYLIDQHAAHERVIFDRVKGEASLLKPVTQGLLSPRSLELSAQELELVHAHGDLLARYGWQIEPFGDRSLLLRGVPAVLSGRDPAEAITGVLGATRDDLRAGDWEDRLAASIACHSAVRAGDSMGITEMEEIVRLMEETKEPHTCPHGRPTMVHVSSIQLEREFRRW